ncbi:MAG: formylglycine-generating enzyme family protein [Candidatus Stygibacter australis]|nr:formylglycine-generating enzyme family protein [Candidatus Stygibacter australis]
MKNIFLFVLLFIAFSLVCNEPPVVSNVVVQQRDDGTYFVDIYYDLEDADGDSMLVSISASDDEGESWDYPIISLSGETGSDITSGTGKQIIWDFAVDHPEVLNIPTMIKITADDLNGGGEIEGMIFVEGGTFNNGTSDVTVSSFEIGQYEVTPSEYQAVMGNNPSYFTGVTNGPVEMVSWFDAIEYCNRLSMDEGITPCYSYSTYGTNPDDWPAGWNLNNDNHTSVFCSWTANGYRLPTEAEWHFVALGGNETHNYTYSGSNNIGEVAWYNSNSGGTTHTVGTNADNELGTFDMSGNVFEWVWDIYNSSYPGGAQTNPHGAVSGSYRVRRGGSWNYDASNCTVYFRFAGNATGIDNCIGFRFCRISP